MFEFTEEFSRAQLAQAIEILTARRVTFGVRFDHTHGGARLAVAASNVATAYERAEWINGLSQERRRNLLLLDEIPKSFGIETPEGLIDNPVEHPAYARMRIAVALDGEGSTSYGLPSFRYHKGSAIYVSEVPAFLSNAPADLAVGGLGGRRVPLFPDRIATGFDRARERTVLVWPELVLSGNHTWSSSAAGDLYAESTMFSDVVRRVLFVGSEQDVEQVREQVRVELTRTLDRYRGWARLQFDQHEAMRARLIRA